MPKTESIFRDLDTFLSLYVKSGKVDYRRINADTASLDAIVESGDPYLLRGKSQLQILS